MPRGESQRPPSGDCWVLILRILPSATIIIPAFLPRMWNRNRLGSYWQKVWQPKHSKVPPRNVMTRGGFKALQIPLENALDLRDRAVRIELAINDQGSIGSSATVFVNRANCVQAPPALRTKTS